MVYLLVVPEIMVRNKQGGKTVNDELRRLLMEQMQLLHEQSRADAILPGELAELSNAMTSIAGVLLQLM